jgi:hypothetical protein
MTKLKRTLALALAGGALAIGVPAALAAGSGGGEDTTTQPSGPAFIQDEGGQNPQDRGDQTRPDGGGPGDCPEKDGQQGGPGDQGGSGDQGSSSDSSGSTAL